MSLRWWSASPSWNTSSRPRLRRRSGSPPRSMRSGVRRRPRPGCLRPSGVGVWPRRWRWRGAIPRTAAAAISGSPGRWCTRCPTPWPRWKPGCLSEWRATLIVRESACLDVEDRRTLDAELCADLTTLDGLGDARITAEAKKIAYRLDPHAVVDRAVRAESERTRDDPAGRRTAMARVSVLLPMSQGRRRSMPTLHRAAATCGDGRGRGQVMADTVYERVTGRPAEVPVPVAVNLVITDETLLAGDTEPARMPGYRADPRGRSHDAWSRPRVDGSAVAGHPAPAVQAPPQWGVGGDGVPRPVVSEGVVAVHRRAR